MKYFLLIILIGLCCLKSFGQFEATNKQGFIITNTGDTVHGFIKNYPVHNLAKEVIFKEETASVYTPYIPEEIKGYSIENIHYLSYKYLELDSENKNKKLRKDSVVIWRFLRKVVEGELDFYVLNETSEASRYFIKSGDSGFTELHRVIKFEGSKKFTYDKYKSELGGLMNNSPDMVKQILQTDFDEKSIAETVDNFNRTKGKSTKTHYKHPTKVDYSINVQLDKYKNEYPTWGFSTGIESHIYKPTQSLGFELSYGLYYSTYSYDGESDYYNMTYTKGANIFYFPFYASYNNKEKVISALFEIGINPCLIKIKETNSNGYIDDGNWTLNFNLMGNIGLNIHASKNISIMYIVHMTPLFLNTLRISFRLNP